MEQIQQMRTIAILFHKWMRRNDIPSKAEEYFGYSNEDMFNEFYSELKEAFSKGKNSQEKWLEDLDS